MDNEDFYCDFEENESGLFDEEEYYFELERSEDTEPKPLFRCWEDREADDAGVPRFGEI